MGWVDVENSGSYIHIHTAAYPSFAEFNNKF